MNKTEGAKIIGLILTVVIFLVCAWQLATLVEPHLPWTERFPFVRGDLSYWDAYALFFWGMGFAFFLALGIALSSLTRLRWCFNSHGSLDPPKWKVWVSFAVIVLMDLYVGLETLEEGMTTFALIKTILLLGVHAVLMGFMFLEKTEEPKKEEATPGGT